MLMNRSSFRATQAYSNVGVQTRAGKQDPYALALLMFEGVLESVAAAQGAIAAQDVNAKVKHIGRAVRILQEGLRTSLDMEQGGELAQNLASLYDYCILRLTQANANNNAEWVAEVGELIRPIEDAWRQMRGPNPPGGSGPQSANAVSQTLRPTAPDTSILRTTLGQTAWA